MIFEISCQFRIESSRRLTGLPVTHPCSRVHGHGFEITCILRGPLDPKAGWVADYHDVQVQVGQVLKGLDHRYLNDVEGLENPTTEILAQWLWNHLKPELPFLHQVVIKETPTTECRYPVY